LTGSDDSSTDDFLAIVARKREGQGDSPGKRHG